MRVSADRVIHRARLLAAAGTAATTGGAAAFGAIRARTSRSLCARVAGCRSEKGTDCEKAGEGRDKEFGFHDTILSDLLNTARLT